VTSDCLGVRGFRISFIPLAGCFSPFPHGTCSLSVAQGVEPWRVVPPASHKISRVSWYSGYQPTARDASSTGLSPPLVTLSNVFECVMCGFLPVLQPQHCDHSPRWFGLFPVRSPLLRESRLISSRRATEMFQFTRCPPSLSHLCREAVSRHHSGGVAPFGISGFFAWMQLPLNVSPVSASFFGLERQGIHRVLIVACATRFAW
jgi:hypothetical protein